MVRSPRTGVPSLLLVLLTGCAAVLEPVPGPASGPRIPRAPSSDPVWAACYGSFSVEGEGDPAADLDRLTAACGPPAGLTAVTPVHVGAAQAARELVERFQFRARAGRCYRVFSVGDPSVVDLDVGIRDPAGHLATVDASRDRWSVVPPRGPLCVEHESVLTLEVAVVEGAGSYVLQVWGDPAPR